MLSLTTILLSDIEDEIVNKELVPLMEDFYADELMYFTSDEFENRILVDGKVKKVDYDELNEKYNSNEFNPVDGKLVRLCDHISALLEADISIKHGITSLHLEEGRKNTLAIYPKGRIVNGIDVYELFENLIK